jgi:fatty acid desaturase
LDPGGVNIQATGVAMPPTDSVRQDAATSGYSTLAREIRASGLLQPRLTYYLWLEGINIAALVAVIGSLVFWRESWWLVLLAPVLAVVSAQIAFFSHDAAHRQICRGSRASAVLGMVHGNLLNGLSYGWWLAKHNAHHAHPNDLESDPDVVAGVIVFDAGQAGERTGLSAWVTRHQALLFFPMLSLEGFNLRVVSARAVLRPGIAHRFREGVLLSAHYAFCVAVLVYAFTWPQALAFVLVHQCLFGVYLGCTFAPSHKGMPTLTKEQAADPLLRQVLTSRNIRGGRLLDIAFGGLNLQIEHHLFPSMARPNLRRAQPIVRHYCQTSGVPYSETTLINCYALALRHLDEVGAPLRPEPPATSIRP